MCDVNVSICCKSAPSDRFLVPVSFQPPLPSQPGLLCFCASQTPRFRSPALTRRQLSCSPPPPPLLLPPWSSQSAFNWASQKSSQRSARSVSTSSQVRFILAARGERQRCHTAPPFAVTAIVRPLWLNLDFAAYMHLTIVHLSLCASILRSCHGRVGWEAVRSALPASEVIRFNWRARPSVPWSLWASSMAAAALWHSFAHDTFGNTWATFNGWWLFFFCAPLVLSPSLGRVMHTIADAAIQDAGWMDLRESVSVGGARCCSDIAGFRGSRGERRTA